MKKAVYLMCALLLSTIFYACSNSDDEYRTTDVTVSLVYPAGVKPAEKIAVNLKNTTNDMAYSMDTNAEGKVVFNVPAGIYEASATETRVDGTDVMIFNGVNSQVSVADKPVEVRLEMVSSKGGSIVIKELYVGGCPKNDGSGVFALDQSVILYNNSPVSIDMTDLVLAIVLPYNATGINKDYKDGALFYEAEKWIPAGMGVWYFSNNVKLDPGKQLVIACKGAIDHTGTYSQSVNYANAEYYCCYDPKSGMDMASHYPNPASVIPTSHYLKAYRYGLGKAWPLSQVSPAFFIFRPKGTDLKSFIEDAKTTNLYGGAAAMVRKKVPVDWVVDGVEVFDSKTKNTLKRLTSSVDAGSAVFTKGLGHTLYRNVDKAATEALPENKDKLVYGYKGGVGKSTDPSGIDAEASLQKGARIIYIDKNNSTEDFHEREKSSLRK